MRKHLSLMLLLLLLITCTACGQRQTVQRMAADRITQAESVAQLQEVSDLIVVFTPERQENILSYFSDGNVSGGYTRTTGTVSQVLKGEPPEQLVITEECYLVDNVLWTQGGYLPMQEASPICCSLPPTTGTPSTPGCTSPRNWRRASIP